MKKYEWNLSAFSFKMEFIYLSCLADWTDFIQTIESAAARGAESGGDEERVETVLDVLHHGLLQSVPPENTLVVWLEDPQLDKSNHGGFLHTRMSFLWMKTNLVFITFLALLIVIKRRGLVLRSFRYQHFIGILCRQDSTRPETQ